MMKFFLSEEQKTQLYTLLKRTRNSRESDRIKAVLLADKGWTRREIAASQFLDEDTIGTHIREYQEFSKLTIDSGGSKSDLTEEQTNQLKKHLEQKTYVKTQEIRDYVAETFGVEYSRNGVTCWLHRNGFS